MTSNSGRPVATRPPAGGVQDAVAPGDVGGERRRAFARLRLTKLGEEPGQVGAPDVVEGAEARAQRVGSQPVGDRSPRQAAAR